MRQLITTVFFAFLFNLSLNAQTRDYQYTKMFWSETVITGKIKGKFNYQLDYQYRRGADPNTVQGGNHNNIFKNPYQQVVRPWIHYQPNDAIRLSLSPFGWWGTWSGIAGQNLQFVPEFRICPQLTLNQQFWRITISQRYRYEFRFLGDKESVGTGWDASVGYMDFGDYMHSKSRFRYFLRTITPLNNATLVPKTFYLDFFNEIFINIGNSVPSTNLLDQNRLFLGLGYRFNSLFRAELGYLSQTAFRFNNASKNNVEQNNILQAFLIFDDFNKLFKKKKKEGE